MNTIESSNNNIEKEETYNYVIKELQNYILDNDFFKKVLNPPLLPKKERMSTKENPKPVLEKEKTFPTPNKEKENYFLMREKDSLFWIFYVLVYGEIEYEKLKPIHLVKEKKSKIEFIEKARLKKSILKTFKFASLVHIENQLLNEVKIDLNTFFSLCVLENKSVFYVNKNTYYELLFPSDESELSSFSSNSILLLTKSENSNQFRFQIIPEKSEILDAYRKTFYKIDLFHKPVKAISNYKVSELKDFCLKLGLEISIKETGILKKKTELYEQLVQYF